MRKFSECQYYHSCVRLHGFASAARYAQEDTLRNSMSVNPLETSQKLAEQSQYAIDRHANDAHATFYVLTGERDATSSWSWL